MDNFSPTIPPAQQAVMLQLATLGAEWIDTLSGDTLGDDPKIEPVEWQSRSGFASRNLGGYSVSQWYSSGDGSGIYHTAGERAETERMLNDAAAAFLRDTGREELPDDDAGREELFAYERDWLADQATIIELELFIPVDTPDMVQVSLLAHYKDAPYYRPKYAEEIYSETLPLDALDPAQVLAAIRTAYGAT